MAGRAIYNGSEPAFRAVLPVNRKEACAGFLDLLRQVCLSLRKYILNPYTFFRRAPRGRSRRRIRRYKAKVLMSQKSDSSIPLDDDDILDLTVVAAPGAGAGASPKPAIGESPDFGADLDALLDSLAPDGTVSAPSRAPQYKAAAPGSPVAAPIEDQTPVSHKVDPNEDMALPETSDIDSLLAELGADIPAEEPEPPAAAPPAARTPASRPDATRPDAASAPLPEFDAILAQAQAAEAKKAAEEAAVPAGPSAAAPPAAQHGTAPQNAAPPAAPDSGAEESLDLNELDALLDDILAAAPEVSAPARSAEKVPSAFSEVEAAPEIIAVPDAALAPAEEPDAALAARILRLEEMAEALKAREDDTALADRVQRLEQGIAALEAGAGNALSEADAESLVAAKIAALLEPGSEAMEKITQAVLAELFAPEGEGKASGTFREKLEKTAAAAAAKVIREEIAAMMREE